jgi:hypothetical protein
MSLRTTLILLLLSAGALVQTGCPTRCVNGTMRCVSGSVQLCRPDKTWQPVVDCGKVDPKQAWPCVCPEAKRCRCAKPASQP